MYSWLLITPNLDMKASKSWLVVALVALALGLVPLEAQAQCAMCKATAETNADGGGVEAEGLNAGIVYLMAMPYLMMGTVGFFWYRSTKKKQAKQA